MPRYFTVNTVIELICFLIGLFCLYKDRNPIWKMIMTYMFIVYIVETCGLVMRLMHRNNIDLYTGYLIIECIAVSVFFYHLYSKYQSRVTLAFYAWLAIFMIAFTVELVPNNFAIFPYKTAVFMSVVFVFACCYFYLLVLRDDTFRELGKYPAFWMVNGMLFYYFGGMVCNIFFDYLLQEGSKISTLSVRYITYNILNVLLYSCWSYAFICRYRQRNSISSS